MALNQFTINEELLKEIKRIKLLKPELLTKKIKLPYGIESTIWPFNYPFKYKFFKTPNYGIKIR